METINFDEFINKDKKVIEKTFRPEVDLLNLMYMCAQEVKAPGIVFGFAMAQGYLKEVCERVIELNDDKLLKSLKGLGLISNKEKING